MFYFFFNDTATTEIYTLSLHDALPISETFHRDGKQELGMGDCQLRSGEGQTRHMYLVMLAYSLLMSQLQQGRAQEWALCKLTTIGESCRAMLRESLRNTIRWAVEQATEKSRDYDHIIAQLAIS